MYLAPIEEDELAREINRLAPNKSPGLDELPPKIIKHTSDLIIKPLTSIFNRSFSEGIFPQGLKQAKIIPIYKKNEHYKPGNYWPISLLNIFSKLLEKLMHKRVYDFLNKFEMLYEYQFGFRKGFSTNYALTEILENLRLDLEAGNFVIGTYLDLSKAFDTVNHDILLYKLNYYGVRGHVQKWFASYLKNRTQITYCNKTYSHEENIKIGVPQGSVLGPLLFIIYMNDIHNCVKNARIRLFADDTNMFISHKNLKTAKNYTETALQNLKQWLVHNHLSLNIDKTCFNIFGGRKNSEYIQEIKVGPCCIKRVTCTRYLGVYIDEGLTWREHIKQVCNKLVKLCSAFHLLSRYIDIDMAKQIYFAYVYPHINYCIEAYGSACSSVLKRVQIMQNKLLKILCCKNYRYSSTQLHKDLHLLSVKEIYEYSVLCFVYKQRNDLLPNIFQDFFQLNCERNPARQTRQSNNIHVIKFKSNIVKNSMKVVGANYWNNITNELRKARTLNIFKKHCKELIMSRQLV